MTQHLYAVHDWSPVWAQWLRDAGISGWCVESHELGADPNNQASHDFTPMVAYGITPIARINYSHTGQGTIPQPDRYTDFARRCANFVRNSRGCQHYIIGNEPSWSVEWPDGQKIMPEMYASCYRLVHQHVKAHVPDAQLMPAAIAPWNIQIGIGWIEYWREMLSLLPGLCDGLAIHTYSRSYRPASISSNERMNAPWSQYHNGFRSYLDFLAAVPPAMRSLPVHVSETNGNEPWPDQNTGWVQEAYAEIERHNQLSGTQKIQSLALFRWLKHDQQWQFETKSGVHEDFKAAIANHYRSPQPAQPQPLPPGPTIPMLPTSPPLALSRQWDKRLDARGVKIETPAAMPGDMVWRVTEAVWLDEQQAGGRHAIYVDIRDSDGSRLTNIPLRVSWPTGSARIVTEAKPGELWSANYPMSPSKNEFSIRVDEGGFASETVTGIGMGADGNPNIHTSTAITFQRLPTPAIQPPILEKGETPMRLFVTAPAGLNIRNQPSATGAQLGTLSHGTAVDTYETQGEWVRIGVNRWVSNRWLSANPPMPELSPPPATGSPPPVTPAGNDWPRIYAFILKWEGGWADHPSDPGGATMRGITIGTYTRWRASQGQPQPTKADLRNISDSEVQAIYREWYWKASGADRLSWPLNLAHMDTAVNAGVGRANEMLQRSGGNFLAYMGHLIDWYTRIETFPTFGRAWIRRRAEILLEAAK